MYDYDSYLARQVEDYMLESECEPKEINLDGELNCDCCDNTYCEYHPYYIKEKDDE